LLGEFYVLFLCSLIPAAKEHNNDLAALYEIDAVSRAVIDPQLANSSPDRLYIAEIAERQTADAKVNSCTSSPISEFGEPLGESLGLPNFSHAIPLRRRL
jgi:hypothetical protein